MTVILKGGKKVESSLDAMFVALTHQAWRNGRLMCQLLVADGNREIYVDMRSIDADATFNMEGQKIVLQSDRVTDDYLHYP